MKSVLSLTLQYAALTSLDSCTVLWKSLAAEASVLFVFVAAVSVSFAVSVFFLSCLIIGLIVENPASGGAGNRQRTGITRAGTREREREPAAMPPLGEKAAARHVSQPGAVSFGGGDGLSRGGCSSRGAGDLRGRWRSWPRRRAPCAARGTGRGVRAWRCRRPVRRGRPFSGGGRWRPWA